MTDEYLKTEDFADLFDETLRRVANERSQEKRCVYKNILTDAIKRPQANDYDERLRFLRTLEGLQAAHIKVLRAIMYVPTDQERFGSGALSGAQIYTLEKRLPGIRPNTIDDLISQLNGMGITDLHNLKTMMSSGGAADLSDRLTRYGQRFVEFVKS